MNDDQRPPHHRKPPTRVHPAAAPLCDRCGAVERGRDHLWFCRTMSERPGLWADGWADLNA